MDIGSVFKNLVMCNPVVNGPIGAVQHGWDLINGNEYESKTGDNPIFDFAMDIIPSSETESKTDIEG